MLYRPMTAFAFLVSLLCGIAVAAGPLPRAWMPADAKWVVHIDIEAGTGSTVGRYVIENAPRWHPEECEALRRKTGLDLAVDIKSITIHGASPDAADAIAIIATTSAVDPFLDKLRGQEPTFARVQVGDITLDSWTEHGSKRYGHTRAVGDSRLILVGRDMERIRRAVEATGAPAEGEEAEPASALLEQPPRAGSWLFIAALDIEPTAKTAKAMILRKARSLRIDLGEAQDNVYADLRIVTGSSQDAADVLKAMEGGLAMARLMAQSRGDLAPLADAARSVTFAASDSAVTASFRHGAGDVIDMLRSVAEPAKAATVKESPDDAPPSPAQQPPAPDR